MAAATAITSATPHDRDRSRHCVNSLSGSTRFIRSRLLLGFSGSTGFIRSTLLLSRTSRLPRRAGQVLLSGRALQPHRKHSPRLGEQVLGEQDGERAITPATPAATA